MQPVPSHCGKTCNRCPARESARRIRLLAIGHSLAFDLLEQLKLSKRNLLKQTVNSYRQQDESSVSSFGVSVITFQHYSFKNNMSW